MSRNRNLDSKEKENRTRVKKRDMPGARIKEATSQTADRQGKQ